MAGRSYASLVFRGHRSFVLFSASIVALLQFLIIKAITTVDADSMTSLFFSQLPERFRLVVNETLISRMTVEGAAAFGFNHPIVIILVAIIAVSVPTRHVSGEIENGVMELLLAHPVGRVRLALSLWVSAAGMTLIVVVGALVGSIIGVMVFHVASGAFVVRLIEIALNLWVLAVLIETVALLVSVWGTRGSRPGLWTAVTVLTFYVLHFLTPLWDVLQPTTPFNLFTYYQPHKLVIGESNFGGDVLVLVAVTAVFLTLAVHRFHTRDIPG